jgi:hypothetical protein
MAIKYYPLTQITPNLYTRGGEFVKPDGKSYTGRYYMTYDGRTFVGINPVVGTNEELIRSSTPQSSAAYRDGVSIQVANNYNYAASKNPATSTVSTKDTLIQLTPYNPFPISDDYSKGYFIRYFAKNVSGPGYIIEISQEDWSLIKNGEIGDNVVGYEITDMLWQLTGPLNDTRVSQYQIIGGVYSTNKRVTEAKQKGFNGIIEFIGGDYTKFARIS